MRRTSRSSWPSSGDLPSPTAAPASETQWRTCLEPIPNIPNDLAYVDELYFWGARAAADLATRAADRRDKDALEQAHPVFASLVDTRASVDGEPFVARSAHDLIQPAMGALFEAERQRLLASVAESQDRADASEKTAEYWRRAAELCAPAGLRWEQHRALLQLGTVLVTIDGATPEAKHALRSAHAYAVEQGAVVLRQAVEAAAGLGRISLTPPTPIAGKAPADASSWGGVLDLLHGA